MNLKVSILSNTVIDKITELTKHLNPETPKNVLKERLLEMFTYNNYVCYGLYDNQELIGISSGWITTRLYSGKQLEIDNVIINPTIQSKGYGSEFLKQIEAIAIDNNCKSIELNTYVDNDRSHKFYFKQGYKILGFHFQKTLNNEA